MSHMRMRKVPMSFRWIATNESIVGGAPSDDPFLRFGSILLATGGIIDLKGHY